MTNIPADPAAREKALADFVTAFEKEYLPLTKRMNEASWRMNVTGSEADAKEAAALETELRNLFARKDAYAFLSGVTDAGGVSDAALDRQRVLLLNAHRSQQIPPEMIARIVAAETALESRFNTFRADLDGRKATDNALRQVLQKSNDSGERRKAWEAGKQIGREVAGDLLALVRLRNESATLLGYPNYYSMSLELDELNETELFELLDDLDRGTRTLFEEYKAELDARLARRFGVAASELRPWHLGDPFFQEAPEIGVNLDAVYASKKLEDLTRDYFAAIGLPVDDVLERSDLYEKPGKCQHAFCMSVDKAADVRVLCNIRSNEQWMGTMLHEFGHAAYDVFIARSLPVYLREPAHLLTTEGSAMLFGRLSKNAAWLTRWAGMPEAEALAAEARTREATRAQLLVQTRWFLVMCHMERALYANPEQDLDTLWWDLVERFQRVRRPEGRSAPDWASKIHFSVAPAYYQNYLLGEMTASQLQRHLLEEVVGGKGDAWKRYVTSPEVGAFLRERFYGSGRLYDWRETVRRATGRPLGTEAFVADLTPEGAASA